MNSIKSKAISMNNSRMVFLVLCYETGVNAMLTNEKWKLVIKQQKVGILKQWEVLYFYHCIIKMRILYTYFSFAPKNSALWILKVQKFLLILMHFLYHLYWCNLSLFHESNDSCWKIPEDGIKDMSWISKVKWCNLSLKQKMAPEVEDDKLVSFTHPNKSLCWKK